MQAVVEAVKFAGSSLMAGFFDLGDDMPTIDFKRNNRWSWLESTNNVIHHLED